MQIQTWLRRAEHPQPHAGGVVQPPAGGVVQPPHPRRINKAKPQKTVTAQPSHGSGSAPNACARHVGRLRAAASADAATAGCDV